MKPTATPQNPSFSSGPCAKRPGWSLDALKDATLGRSHRAKTGKGKLAQVIDRSKAVLGIPGNYVLAIVPGSDTGAIEMALWSMLGERGVDVLAWESFGSGWAADCKSQLKLKDLRVFKADYGQLPDVKQVDWTRDVVFTWNGTTSGVKVPNGDWIADDRQGLAICDATSAVFAMEIPWQKLDVVTWSWQKVLGGEGAHGMIALSPRAVQRLETYTPDRPLPKLFQMVKGGKLVAGLFQGETINTPSMLCVEDALDGLAWAESIGGLPCLIARSHANLRAIEGWVAKSSWAGFLAAEPSTRSNTSICLKVVDPAYATLAPADQEKHVKSIVSMLEKAGAAYDIGAYRDAPPGLRIWGGATVETSDIQALLPWLDWAYSEVKSHPSKRNPMPRVLISDSLSPRAIEAFKQAQIEADVKVGLSESELIAIIGDYDGLAIRSATKVTAKVLDAATRLKVVGRAGIGVDNVDVPAATARRVVVMNTPFGNSVTTAEHAISMMMALARQIASANASTHAGKWQKSKYMGVELTGKVLGVIGCGNIGSLVADRAQGLKMRVLAYDPVLTAERAKTLGVEKVELDELLRTADFITLHTPLTEQTRYILDKESLAKTKKGVRIINCARGGLINEADLKAAIESGHVAGAALDVFEKEPATANPLFGLEQVIATPHLGASTHEAQENVAVQVAEQIAEYLNTGAVINAVNHPPAGASEA